MRQALEQRQKLRLQHFDGDEYEALFGQQQLLDQPCWPAWRSSATPR
jgi:hypothetical protein